MQINIKKLIERFYFDLWNKSDAGVATEILHPDFRFRGSLGQDKRGRDGFIHYMRTVHTALADYQCVIDELIVENQQASAKMTFKGIHQAPFFGVEATGREIKWAGAAFFRSDGEYLTELWVLGDIDHIKSQLELI